MLGALYDALRHAPPVPDEVARKAAEEVASYENRLAKIEGDLTLIKWMGGVMVTLQLLTFGGLLSLIWRLVPLTK
jgi:hypothetical protein